MDSVGDLSKDTWQKGILSEIKKRGIRGGTVLDLGGGNGVGSDLLQSIGMFQVTALDSSPAMLELNRTATKKVVTDFLKAKDLPDRYDLVVSGFDSLNYLNPKHLPELFNGFAKILNPNGLVIFDYSSPKFLSVDWSDTKFSQDVLGGRLDWKTKFDPRESRCDLELVYWTGEKQEWAEAHSQYTVNAYQIQDALQGSGLAVEYVRNLNGETFSPQANTHVYVIREIPQEQ
jgi:ubiquinone/menaquinone biosynthesis C-methylase UbiE